MPVEFAKKGEKILVTVNPQLSHGFAYGDDEQPLDDYYPGDTLFVTQGSAVGFIAQGWVVKAAQGAKPGRAPKAEAQKPDAPKK
jgi:hypothetical protein